MQRMVFILQNCKSGTSLYEAESSHSTHVQVLKEDDGQITHLICVCLKY